MKKRIWNRIKRTGLTAVLAGILMVSVSAQAQMILPEEERTGKCSSMNENENGEFFYSASDGKDTEDSMIFIEEQEDIPLQEESMETPEENIREENQDSDAQTELPEKTGNRSSCRKRKRMQILLWRQKQYQTQQ